MINNNEILKSSIKKIIDKFLWGFSLSETTGSIVSFECGDKKLRQNIGNIGLNYEGEHSFMFYCSWRITDSNTIVTSWKDNVNQLKFGTASLENLKILSIQVSDRYDISINFENGFVFEAFCDLSINNDFDCNWFFRDGKTYYSLTNNNEIQIE